MSGDKTEEPTEHKLREARKKGQISKSQDVTSAAIFLIGFFMVYFSGQHISSSLQQFILLCIATSSETNIGPGIIIEMVQAGVDTMLSVVMPLFAVAFIVAFFANYAQVGVLITFDPLKPNIKKLNPIEGMKGMFKLRKLVELIKSTLKLLIVSLVAFFVVKAAIIDIILTIRSTLYDTIDLVWSLIFDLSVRIGVIFGIIAAADWAYQKWQYKKDMKMSKKEVRDEYKNQEGDPFIKSKRKQLHQEMAMNSVVQETSKADAVVVNPDHIAVAIRYDKENMQAPQIIAKGERLWAEKIKEIAKAEGIPILRNVPLASALNKLEIGEEVPEELYDAVAEILQFVYQLAEERGETS
jgi:flagellar biosynthetic protein FlhB